jgi:hypothetical protein
MIGDPVSSNRILFNCHFSQFFRHYIRVGKLTGVVFNFRRKTALFPDPCGKPILVHPNPIPEVNHVKFFVTNIFQIDLSQPILSQKNM